GQLLPARIETTPQALSRKRPHVRPAAGSDSPAASRRSAPPAGRRAGRFLTARAGRSTVCCRLVTAALPPAAADCRLAPAVYCRVVTAGLPPAAADCRLACRGVWPFALCVSRSAPRAPCPTVLWAAGSRLAHSHRWAAAWVAS